MTAPSGGRRVFLSHTSELRTFPRRRSYVAAAEVAVATAGHVVVDMAYFPARDRAPADVCREAVLTADVLVLVAGFRYGSLLAPSALSHTEWEFQTAGDAHVPRFVFLLADDADGATEMVGDRADADRQRAFRGRLRAESGLTVAMVDSPGSLQAALLHALHVGLVDRATRASGPGPGDVVVRDSSYVQIGDHTVMTTVNPGPPRRRYRWWPRRG